MVDFMGCKSCHGAKLQGKVDNGQPGPTPGPNLTKIVPGMTEEQFMAFFNTGKITGGRRVPMITLTSGFSEPGMPWSSVRATTTYIELKDMYKYLHGLAVMEDKAK